MWASDLAVRLNNLRDIRYRFQYDGRLRRSLETGEKETLPRDTRLLIGVLKQL